MTSASYERARPAARERLAYELRVLRVIARTQFRLKYVDSILGYAWSLAKPLAYFGVLWVVFGRFFNTGVGRFPLYLLIGIVLFTYLTDAVGMALPSIVERGPLLRRIAFPPALIPLSATLTATLTFGVNLVAVTVFLVIGRVTPEPRWLLLVPLLLELYIFIVGLGLLISTLFVHFHDIGPIWELAAQLMLFATPIIYPITILPTWAEHVVMLNPFVQILQDVRYVVLGPQPALGILPTSTWWHVAALTVTACVFGLGLFLYRRSAPYFAERV